MARTHSLPIRLDPAQYEQFRKAAKRAGKSPSEWLRDLGAVEVAETTVADAEITFEDMSALPGVYKKGFPIAQSSRHPSSILIQETPNVPRGTFQEMEIIFDPEVAAAGAIGAVVTPNEPGFLGILEAQTAWVESWAEVFARCDSVRWGAATRGIAIPAHCNTVALKLAWLDANHPHTGLTTV